MHPPLGQNMIKFEHDTFQISRQKICWKRYDGANASKWNILEIEPFVVWWNVQEENTCELGVVENHMSPWNVVGKGKCCCLFMLWL
jgi:hypothetical protein